jgi:hypothetical protein
VNWGDGSVAKLNEEDALQRGRREADAELLGGIRRNEARALREFVLRFEPVLLDQARRLDVGASERRTVVTGFLDDILVKLASSPAPRSLPSFVLTSFRNCVTDMHRETALRARHSAAQDDTGGDERVVIAGCSEFMLRAAEGPAAEYGLTELNAGAELVHALFAECTREDRQLLVWSAHRVPLRECAEWLGISYDSAKQRLTRLRARLIRRSIAHLSELSESDRAHCVRLLDRAGVRMHDDQTEGSAA